MSWLSEDSTFVPLEGALKTEQVQYDAAVAMEAILMNNQSN